MEEIEDEVLGLIIMGFTSKEIAIELEISLRSVTRIRSRIKKSLCATTMEQAIFLAIKSGRIYFINEL